MSKPREPDPAKLFLSAIYRQGGALEKCLQALIEKFGPSDYSSRELEFTITGYYEREMGEPLYRRFFSFRELCDPARLAEIKLFTNDLEQDSAVDDRRAVNLDPGLISMGSLILATGKPVAHRPYLGRGVYADLTLVYESGSFKPLPWTYPDYRAPELLEFLNRLRAAYKHDLREWKDRA